LTRPPWWKYLPAAAWPQTTGRVKIVFAFKKNTAHSWKFSHNLPKKLPKKSKSAFEQRGNSEKYKTKCERSKRNRKKWSVGKILRMAVNIARTGQARLHFNHPGQ
jgi:hypothetical protein